MGPAKYTIKEEDHVAFNALHFRASVPRGILVGLVTAGILAAAAYILDDEIAAIAVAVGGVAGFLAVLAIVRFFVVPRQAKRAWRDFALIREPFELSLDDGGFKLVQPSASVASKWCDMIAWNEDARVFAIYVTQQQAYIMPKDQIEPALIDFARERLIDSGLGAKGKKRK